MRSCCTNPLGFGIKDFWKKISHGRSKLIPFVVHFRVLLVLTYSVFPRFTSPLAV